MKLKLFLICTLLLVGCTGPKYEKEDIIAVLEGAEVTVEDVLWQYSLEKEEEKIINWYLKQEIVIQESQARGITVSEDEIDEIKQELFPGSKPPERYEYLDDKSFYEQQAALLGVSPEEYYEIWEGITLTKQAYVEKYIDEKLGGPTEEEVDLWAQKIDEHIDELFDTYKKEGKLVIK
ncbi:hypothetical protein [Halalkalibacter alkaliphilus]|uniref:Uncharacterized protein n=1 Tax=Halalkalibacter alkaliphilus TaxID=2917993 RepID=A0A9X1ZW70_9BACI|nr:hypothetical protein [Halalkalibacter alkaliphilus]MCL7745521.1 hypothetical protein [Halalkalibacter alkaliphilus]